MTMPQIPTPGNGAPQQSQGDGGSFNWKELMDNSGGAFEPLPQGDYDIQVTKAEATKTSNGKLMYKLTMSVVAGPHTNRKLWANQVVSPESPNALSMFFMTMKNLGCGPEFFGTNPTPEQVADKLEGAYARVQCSIKEYPKGSGQMRNEVGRINPAVIQGGQGAMPTVAAPAAAAPAPQAAPAPAAPAPQQQAPAPAAPAPAQPAAPAAAPEQPAQPVAEAQPTATPPAAPEAPQPPAQPVQEQPQAAAPPAQPVQQEAPAAPAPAPAQEQPAPQAPPAAPQQSGTPAPPPMPF